MPPCAKLATKSQNLSATIREDWWSTTANFKNGTEIDSSREKLVQPNARKITRPSSASLKPN
ncbi:MAG: hypothetical protein DWI21_08375 [Planctomycetota bacterium]|nr:MAG: hypothetical protein DWI21_08375 [Planctomycetota bacterium]GDY07720.1 hypothetical protein LBMAG52_12060 [Planctomycetia bacterium]